MQLYAGLPIITNKITVEEQQGIRHHLLGCIGLQEQTWVVGTFVREALRVIEEIRSRGRLPILVGGTHYYTQSLLFNDNLADPGNAEQDHEDHPEHDSQEWPVLEQPTEQLLEELKRIDPDMAERWHPKDRRKIQRSLEIYLKTGRKASEVYAEQRARKAAQTPGAAYEDGKHAVLDGPAMRFSTLLFWVHAETDVLRERLDNRVDKMLEAGLLDEVRALNAHAEAEAVEGHPVDETRGIWVSIGYKEFKSYLQTLQTGNAPEKELQKLKAEALERTKIATRQYAKRQVRWIRIKLVNALSEANMSDELFLLDGSDVSALDTRIVEPAAELTQLFLQASPLPKSDVIFPATAELLKPTRDHGAPARPDKWTKQHCEVCNVTCVIDKQWEQHVRSKAHTKLLRKRRQQALEKG